MMPKTLSRFLTIRKQKPSKEHVKQALDTIKQMLIVETDETNRKCLANAGNELNRILIRI
jgi:hypothetical protein